jgi:sigma-B regulation protein RsbU (phosphoserine phosphatase)
LCKLNDLLHADLECAGYFITACCAVFDATTRELNYASAGHPPPLLLRGGERGCTTLDADGCLLGIAKIADFTDVKVKLQTGDIVVFYTDGITEMQNAAGAMFGVGRLGETVAANRAEDPETMVARVLATLDGFAGGTVPEDDLTIVVMKLTA